MEKRTLIITILLILTLGINSYGGTVFKPDGDKEINGMRVQLNGNASSFDSALSDNRYELSLVNNMFEGLYRVKDDKVVPGMAKIMRYLMMVWLYFSFKRRKMVRWRVCHST